MQRKNTLSVIGPYREGCEFLTKTVLRDRGEGARLSTKHNVLVPLPGDFVIIPMNLGAPGLDFETWETTNLRG